MTSDSTLIHDAELPADSTDAPDEWVELGRTAGAYGFKGWVRIAPLASGEVLEHSQLGVGGYSRRPYASARQGPAPARRRIDC